MTDLLKKPEAPETADRPEYTVLGKSHPRVANPYDPVNRRVEMRIRTE